MDDKQPQEIIIVRRKRDPDAGEAKNMRLEDRLRRFHDRNDGLLFW